MAFTDWRNLMKYQDLIRYMPPALMELLDTMQSLVPIDIIGVSEMSRTDAMLQWIRICYEHGIISGLEKREIQHEMIHGCGGF